MSLLDRHLSADPNGVRLKAVDCILIPMDCWRKKGQEGLKGKYVYEKDEPNPEFQRGGRGREEEVI